MSEKNAKSAETPSEVAKKSPQKAKRGPRSLSEMVWNAPSAFRRPIELPISAVQREHPPAEDETLNDGWSNR